MILEDTTNLVNEFLEKKKNELTREYQAMLIRAFNHEIRHPLNSIQTLSILETNNIKKA